MKLTLNIWQRCQSAKLSLEELFYLYLASVEDRTSESVLQDFNLDKLMDLGLIEKDTKLPSDTGKILLFHLLSEEEQTAPYTQDFEEFWKLFPVSDKYAHYPKTRTLRTNKQETFKEWLKAKEKTSSNELISALCQDISNRERESARTNAFKYMKGPTKWLADKMYEEIEKTEPQSVDTDDLM